MLLLRVKEMPANVPGDVCGVHICLWELPVAVHIHLFVGHAHTDTQESTSGCIVPNCHFINKAKQVSFGLKNGKAHFLPKSIQKMVCYMFKIFEHAKHQNGHQNLSEICFSFLKCCLVFSGTNLIRSVMVTVVS